MAWRVLPLAAGLLVVAGLAQAPDQPPGPLTPREALKSFRVPKGFKVELVACEPQVIDPVAMAFDEDGRLFVAEMPGYPNGGVATGDQTSGRVKLLKDQDRDGVYQSSVIVVEGLRFPTSVMPYRGGLLVANAPDLIYCQDTTGKGKADSVRTLYSGFHLANIQQLPSGLQWSLDNWVHGCAGNVGGTIVSGEKPALPATVLRGRGFRLHPDIPGSLEPTSGGGQFGLAPDRVGNWFTATNSQHLRHIVLPERYLKRNADLPVTATTLDIPDHGAACKVFRISPFENWRMERTKRRKDGPDAKRFPATELIPGGYITSACSPVVYEADLFPPEYHGNVFVCDPANNLIHRDVLELKGATFVAKRGDPDSEFFASTDTWCRPVAAVLGPDGALYVLDFYREVIETPLSLPEDMKAKLPLKSQGKGRIWRIVPEGKELGKQPQLSRAEPKTLVVLLDNPNYFQRITAQRLLVEKQAKQAVPALLELARAGKTAAGRMHALCTLDGLHGLTWEAVAAALKDPDAGVRQHAVRLAEPWLAKEQTAGQATRAVAALAADPSPALRFQLAFSLGEAGDAAAALEPLATLLIADAEDPWTRVAVLSSCPGDRAGLLLEALARHPRGRQQSPPALLPVVTQLTALANGKQNADAPTRVLALAAFDQGPPAWQIAVLEGWGQSLKSQGLALAKVWESPLPKVQRDLNMVRPVLKKAGKLAVDDKADVAERALAVRVLGFGPLAEAEATLEALLTPQAPAELQAAAARALAQHDQPKVGAILLKAWPSASPSLRRELIDALLARVGRVEQLLDAIAAKKIAPSQLEPAKLTLLRKHPDAKVRARALTLLKNAVAPERQQVVANYQKAAIAEKPSPERGKMLFKKNCAVCHKLDNEGVDVGPDLRAVLANKDAEALLIDILDPSREVDPRYLDYVVTLKDGRVVTGMIAAESAASLTLRRAENASETLLRSQIDTIQATSKSLMPEGLEMQLPPQAVYDVIAYLLEKRAK